MKAGYVVALAMLGGMSRECYAKFTVMAVNGVVR